MRLKFAAALGGYLLLAGSLTWTEGLAGLAVAGLVAAFVHQQAREGRRLAARRPPLSVVMATLTSFVTDTVRVGAVLARALAGRGPGGDASWQAFEPGCQDAGNAGRRAMVTILTSMAPNGFVLDIRPSTSPKADHHLLMHRLAPTPPLSGGDWPV